MLKRIRRYHKEKVQKIFGLIPYNELLKEGLIAGVGWAIGVTIGFALISTLLVLFLNYVGGIPLVGKWLSEIVSETQNQLMRRTIFSR